MLTAFGKFLRKLRIDNLITMREMSDSLEVSVSYMSAVETGKRKIPNDWKNKIIEIYDLNENQQKELNTAVNNSLTEINLKLNELTENQRDIALIFARELDSLDDEKIANLRLNLKEKGEDKFAVQHIVCQKFNKEENCKNKRIRHIYDNKNATDNLYTIGYEGISVDSFLNILKLNQISVIFDVRENPLSRKKGFSKNNLNEVLAENDILYSHIKELGSPKEIRENLHKTGDYKKFFDDYRIYLNYQSLNIQILKTAVSENPNKNFCLMCFEKKPQECHRSIIAERLIDDKIITTAHHL